MKKSVILSILVIYIFAICVVGFIGGKLKVYNETIYVESIVCENKDYKEATGKTYNGSITQQYVEGLTIQLKCKGYPENATNPKLHYFFDESKNDLISLEERDNTAIITFKKPGTIYITVRSDDANNASLVICVIASDLGSIF